MSCGTNGRRAAVAGRAAGVNRTAAGSAYTATESRKKFSWYGSAPRLRRALATWAKSGDDAPLLGLRAELAEKIAATDPFAAADERARLLLSPPASLSVAERVERIAAIDDAVALLRRRGDLDDAGYRRALIDIPRRMQSRLARSQKPVSWLSERPVGAEQVTAAPADPNCAITTRYRLVEADEPVASHLPDGTANPAYDARLQPRDRGRATPALQVGAITRNLNPAELLKPVSSWGDGPPIVNQEGMVESGNGRMLALRRAVTENPQGYAAYRRNLAGEAHTFGFSSGEVERLKAPVLVRERLTGLTPDEQARFVYAANGSGAARMGAAEQAVADAGLLSPAFFSGLRLSAGDETSAEALGKSGNAEVARRFLGLLPDTEAASLTDQDGHLSAEGINRLERGLLAYALPGRAGERLANLIYEQGELINRVGAGIRGVLPKLSALESGIRVGNVASEARLGEDLAVATEKLHDLQRQKLSVNDYLRQYKMAPELTPFQEQLLAQLDDRRHSGRRVSELLNAYANAAIQTPSPRQSGFFDQDDRGTPSLPLRESLLRTALAETGGSWVEMSSWSAAQRVTAGIEGLSAPRVQALDAAGQRLGVIVAGHTPARRGVNWEKKWTAPGANGRKWTVARDGRGRWGCTCPAWKYQRKPEGAGPGWWREPCRHIKHIQAREAPHP